MNLKILESESFNTSICIVSSYDFFIPLFLLLKKQALVIILRKSMQLLKSLK